MIKRSKFFGVVLLVFGLLLSGCGKKSEEPYVYEEIVELDGISREYELIFVADSHISLCDDRDAGVSEKAAQRYEMFRSPEGLGADETFHNVMQYVKKEQPDLLILGGDIIDSAMWASIDFVSKELESTGVKWVYSMGNHDFEYDQEYYTERAYEEYLPRLQNISKTLEGCQIVDFEDFVILMADDESNRVSEHAADTLAELSTGEKPVILVSHVPIEPKLDNTLWQESINVWGAGGDGNSRVLLGDRSCWPDEATRKMLDLVFDENSPVELVLAGHIHFYHRDALNERLIQVVTGACFDNEIVKVTIKPAQAK